LLAAFSRRLSGGIEEWPERYESRYKPGKFYEPHNDDEAAFVYQDVPRFVLIKGGWGSGKSTANVVKLLDRVRRGMDCIMVSPDWPHFKKSFWPTFREWCPWDMVVEKFQKYQHKENMPGGAGTIVFKNRAQVHYGGIKDATSWFGGNVHYAAFDESSRYPDASAFKSLVSRTRLVGPNGEPPQVGIATTPEMNWLYDYFGPAPTDGRPDPFESFKRDSFVVTIETADNIENLSPTYIDDLRATLTPEEVELYLQAMWVRVATATKFVNLVWWDACMEQLPALTRSEPMILGLDAAKGGDTQTADCFAVVGVTRHPHRTTDLAVRYCGIWKPPPGQLLDYGPIDAEVRRLCRDFAVVELAYDPTQLHYFCQNLKKEGIAHAREFLQGSPRLKADKGLQDLIIAKRISHDGNPLLREHIDNADIKLAGQDGIRIIKRAEGLKVDASVALAMAADRAMYYNLA